MRLKISPARWFGPPTPDDAKNMSPGRERASAMYSCKLRAGTEGCTTSITVLRVNSEIGAKSFSGS